MNFTCQQVSYNLLKEFADKDKHSLVIEGPIGSGKTHLAKQYAEYVGSRDVIQVDPKVSEVKQAFEDFSKVQNKVVIVVENLDIGVKSSSYVLLKYMEEPSSNLYVVVTCRSKQNIPETILSRSMTVTLQMPTMSDINLFASTCYNEQYKANSKRQIWRCVKTFSDVDELCNLSDKQLDYISSWDNLKMFSGPVNSISWKLSHYEDGSEAPCNLIVRYIMMLNNDNKHIVECCKNCLDQLNLKRVASYLTLTKLVFDLKYCE